MSQTMPVIIRRQSLVGIIVGCALGLAICYDAHNSPADFLGRLIVVVVEAIVVDGFLSYLAAVARRKEEAARDAREKANYAFRVDIVSSCIKYLWFTVYLYGIIWFLKT